MPGSSARCRLSESCRSSRRSYEPRDLTLDIGTAGSTGLVLQTLPLADRPAQQQCGAGRAGGGDVQPWRAGVHVSRSRPGRGYLWAFAHADGPGGCPSAGFYPKGGGRLEAWVEPASLGRGSSSSCGPLRRIRGIAGVANLRDDITGRMLDRAVEPPGGRASPSRSSSRRSAGPARGRGPRFPWSPSTTPRSLTFVGLGERGKPSEAVADEAVRDQLLSSSRPSTGPPSIPTRPTRSCCPWPSRRAAAPSPSARSPSTSAPGRRDHQRLPSTAPSPSRSPRAKAGRDGS